MAGLKPTVSAVACDTYDPLAIRRAVETALAPLGGIKRFVHPGMRVLLKPNLLTSARTKQAVTTHPAVVQAVAELVQQAGGTTLIGDSPAGDVSEGARVYRSSGMSDVAARTGARLVPFKEVEYRRLNGGDYTIARPVFEADLVINLPKLKTHVLTLYTGAVKNLFGTIPGQRKREAHYRAPGVKDFSRVLTDVLELVRPGLTIMDGVWGQEGTGPGAGGTPRRYNCLAASTDPVALDAVIARGMGYRPGAVLHLTEAGARGLGVADPDAVRVEGDKRTLDFGPVAHPASWLQLRIPAWVGAPLRLAARLRPRVVTGKCIGCGRCAEVCPQDVITPGTPPTFRLDDCVGCLCCAEVCPQGAIEPYHNLLGRLLGFGL